MFQSSVLAGLGLPFEVRELFVTRSRRDVVRGLHYQGPPSDVAKLVACVDGSVLDAVVDLRVGSPTYLEHCVVELSPERGQRDVRAPRVCPRLPGHERRRAHALRAVG